MSIKRNALANVMGAVLPAIAMLVTLPVIVHQLGTEQYGLLTLVMAITGYFALVDINVTAGSVKYIAEYHARGDFRRMNEVITFGALFYIALGILGCVAILFAAPALVEGFIKLPPSKVPVALEVMQIAAIGFLFSQLQSYANSIPQSIQAYGLTARAEMLFGVFVPVATAGLLLGGGDLLTVVAPAGDRQRYACWSPGILFAPLVAPLSSNAAFARHLPAAACIQWLFLSQSACGHDPRPCRQTYRRQSFRFNSVGIL